MNVYKNMKFLYDIISKRLNKSIVILLFLGSQWTTVSAECTPSYNANYECSSCTDESDMGFYFVNSKVIEVYGSGTCREVTTPGYYKIGDNYYSVNSNGDTHNSLGQLTDTNDCTAGALIEGGALCVDTDTDHAISMDGDQKLYLIVDTSGGLLSGTNDKKIVVKSIKNGFSVVTLQNPKKYLVNDVAQLLGSKENDIIVVDDNVAIDDGIDGSDYCVDNNWNVFERKDGLCNAVVDEDDEDCPYYYTCNKGKACEENNANEKCVNECIPTVATKCSEGYYLIKGGAYVKESTVGDGVLWHCSGTGDDDDECVDKSTGSSAPLGYLTNAGDSGSEPYIECTSSTTCKIATIGDTCEATANTVTKAVSYGSLYDLSAIKICLYDDTEKSLEIKDENKGIHVIEKKAALFGIEAEDQKSIAIEIDDSKNILLMAHDTIGYYITSTTGTAAENTSMDAVGVLFNCEDASTHLKCTSVTNNAIPNGYLVNTGVGTGNAPYISCEGTTGCKAISVAGKICAESVDASSNTITTGALFKGDSDENYSLCIYDGTAQAVEIKSDNKGNYFVSISSSLFGITGKDDHYIVVNIDEKGNITVVKDSVRYRYTLNGEVAIHSRSSAKDETGDGEICHTGVTPYEYILDQWSTDLASTQYYYVKEEN
ncbi:hypothetical protein LY90DRAFT_512890 [Neocallimastix californiae]|uniref:Uncharacterized protein n=1 Tax=Neocallimastix californiae TaxID=1754190 RepID=A0A1Y2B4C5_9FUNG|nr:hypothetical protein LY90DRAFT_512890 [Neocallimastix californiae]|eukprot:ORY29400.1 hypothetical protein LY90DRAFT_512890 [Neocallimastix californiae]